MTQNRKEFTMSKKILAILASARKNGNTSALLDVCLNGAEEAGAEAERICIGAQQIAGCLGCEFCHKNHALCIQKDAMQPLYEKNSGGRRHRAGQPGLLRRIHRPAQSLYRPTLLPDGKEGQKVRVVAHRRGRRREKTATAQFPLTRSRRTI